MKSNNFLALVFLVTLFFAVNVFNAYLETISIAILLSIATYRIQRFLFKRIKIRILTSFFLTIMLTIMFFFPIIYLAATVTTSLSHIDDGTVANIELLINKVLQYLLVHYSIAEELLLRLANELNAEAITQYALNITSYLGTEGVKFLKDILLILIFYFFITLYGKRALILFQRVIPLSKANSLALFEDLASVLGIVFYSILVTAIFEGALFGIMVGEFGYDPYMFGIMYGIASLIPFIGGAIMWIPLALNELANDNMSNAIVIALYSVIMISLIADTFVKPLIIKYINKRIIKKNIHISDLLIFFSIIAGITSYGFWGMIIGPAVLTMLISIIKIYPKISREVKRASAKEAS